MPRPGHRPYECVRRAWHSDRHQPMRGSLIQEIFRVVHEIHSSATKKNKEWQEKLPIVVLKAEEIMYSKANSEAEYMDLETLWDRANDAIKTIIRLDETTETGVFLQPCIEAALNLGCTPRRASRSQRNSTPSYYLSPSSPDPICVHSSNFKKTTQGNHRTSNLFMSTYLNFMRSTTMSFPRLGVKSQSPAVYPLYYGDHLQSTGPAFSFDTPSKLNSHSLEPAELGVMQNLSSCKTNALSKITQADIIDTAENSHETGCDLSLRLGCLGVPCKAIENSIPKEVENVGSRTPQEGNKMSDSSPQIGKKPFFHKSCSGDPVDTSPSNWTSETEILNVKNSMRKRKAVFDHLCEDKQFFWHPKLPFNNLTGWTSNAAST